MKPNPDGSPRWEALDAPGLEGLSMEARLQVIMSINTCMLIEVVRQLGGRAVLEPGFADRLKATSTIKTRFLEDGSYELTVVPTEDDQAVVGLGGRFERMRGPGKEPEIFEVVEEDAGGGHVGLVQVLPERGQIVIRVRERALRKERGWKRWRPPLELIQNVAEKT